MRASYRVLPWDANSGRAPFRGYSRPVARALQFSLYTVQEHLTAIFDNIGVRSRGELVGQVFFLHCLPEIGD